MPSGNRAVTPVIGKLLLAAIVLTTGATMMVAAMEFTEEAPEEEDPDEIVTTYLNDLEVQCDGHILQEGSTIDDCAGPLEYATPEGLIWGGEATTVRVEAPGRYVEFTLEPGDETVTLGCAVPDTGEITQIHEDDSEDLVVIEIAS